MLQQAHSHYDSHAADTNAPYNMLTHIKNGYGFGSVYTSDTYTFLIHIRFCSLCILLCRKVLACSTYLLASMTDHPCRDLLFMYMRCVPHNHPYWLCLSPHPKLFRRRCGQSTVMATMKKTRYLKINTFMQHKPIPSLLHIKNRMRIRNIHTNYRCILFYHIRFSLFYY